MTRRRTTNAGEILKGHLPAPKVDIAEVIVEPAQERTHMQALIAFLASSLDDPAVDAPNKIKIISRLTSSDTELMKVDAGISSEWIMYIPELRESDLQSFNGAFIETSTDSADVAQALSRFKDRRKNARRQMGLPELQYLLKLPREVLLAVLRESCGIPKMNVSQFYIFPEIRFRARGVWHTLALGCANGVYQAYAIGLSEMWQDDFFIIDRAV